MLILEWVIIGFFSAVGWKGADYVFERMGWEPTSVTQIVKKDEMICRFPDSEK